MSRQTVWSGYAQAEYGSRPEDKLAKMLNCKLDMAISGDEMRDFVSNNFTALSSLSHAIHDAHIAEKEERAQYEAALDAEYGPKSRLR